MPWDLLAALLFVLVFGLVLRLTRHRRGRFAAPGDMLRVGVGRSSSGKKRNALNAATRVLR